MEQTTASPQMNSTKKNIKLSTTTYHAIINSNAIAGRKEKLRQEMSPREIIKKNHSNMKIIATLVQELELSKYEHKEAQFNIEQHLDCQEEEYEKWKDERKKWDAERSDLKRRCGPRKNEPAQQLDSDYTILKQEYARVKRQLRMLRQELGRMGE